MQARKFNLSGHVTELEMFRKKVRRKKISLEKRATKRLETFVREQELKNVEHLEMRRRGLFIGRSIVALNAHWIM